MVDGALIVGEPDAATLSTDADLRALVSALRPAAIAWAERREWRDVEGLAQVFEEPGGGLKWVVADVVEQAFSGVPLPGRPASPTLRMAIGYVRTVAGRRIAEMVTASLATRGIAVGAIADAWKRPLVLNGDSPVVPPEVVAVNEWLAAHLGNDWNAVEPTMELVGRHLVYAFGELAREHAEERARSVERSRDTPLRLDRVGSRLLMPHAIVQNVALNHRDTFARTREQVEQGTLFSPEPDRLVNYLRDAEVNVNRMQLGHLAPMEVRALAAVLRLFTTGGDDGDYFRSDTIDVDARIMYQAGSLQRSGRVWRDFFDALDTLAGLHIHATVRFHDAVEKRAVVTGERIPIFYMRPYWYEPKDGRSKRSVGLDAIEEAWGRRGLLPATARKPWTLPLPDRYELRLHPMMLHIGDSLAMPSEVLDRLDRGAKLVRGPTESFHGLDWRLWIEVTQTMQPNSVSDAGDSLRAYVDRDAVLADFYGAEGVKHAKARGRYPRMVGMFLKAGEVLRQGGLVSSWEPDYRTKNEGKHRSVFVPDPAMIGGLGRRAAAAAARRLADKAQAELPLAKGKRKR